jgi:hypothetical protein
MSSDTREIFLVKLEYGDTKTMGKKYVNGGSRRHQNGAYGVMKKMNRRPLVLKRQPTSSHLTTLQKERNSKINMDHLNQLDTGRRGFALIQTTFTACDRDLTGLTGALCC